MIAAVYVRVSTDEQAQHGVSLAGQLAACAERAAELGGNARALGKRGLLRLVREADADAQLAFLSVLFDRVEVLPGRVLRVVHSGGVLPDVELRVGG